MRSKFIVILGDKETVLDIYGQKATGDQFERKQTEKELMQAINAKN